MTGPGSAASHSAPGGVGGRLRVDRPKGVRVRRRRHRWIAEARRERRQHEVPLQHHEGRIRRQAVGLPEGGQRLEHEARRDEGAARDAEHGCVRHAEALCGDGGAEVDLVPHDHIGRPPTRDRDESLGPLARHAARERRPDRARLALGIDGEQRLPLIRRERLAPPEANAVNPAASTVATIPSCPANATT